MVTTHLFLGAINELLKKDLKSSLDFHGEHFSPLTYPNLQQKQGLRKYFFLFFLFFLLEKNEG